MYVVYHCIWCSALGVVPEVLRSRCVIGSSEPQPQHLVLNTICSGIERTQPNTPDDGHIDARNM